MMPLEVDTITREGSKYFTSVVSAKCVHDFSFFTANTPIPWCY